LQGVRLDDLDHLPGQRSSLLCGEHDIRVFGQKNHFLGSRRLHRLDQLRRGWVHRLATRDDLRRAEALE
jgi:hypothetical protein